MIFIEKDKTTAFRVSCSEKLATVDGSFVFIDAVQWLYWRKSRNNNVNGG